ncbi:hypothetical protein TNCV_2756661 [Trichonephila clavipes]|nr:hypothetical protein TNCV_2756661 [Trichonephila clavipes]
MKWVFKNWTDPSQSPDLNRTETLWDELNPINVASQIDHPQCWQLTSAAIRHLEVIPMTAYQKLVESLPGQMQAIIVVKGEGDPTSY